ncbi:MAG: polysaccharide biosynthesis C-terminal domain-containing protein [Candidatus Bathyarchaeia archaeon]
MATANSGHQNPRIKGEISTLFTTVAASYGMNLIGILPSVFTVYFSTRVFAPDVTGQLALITTAALFLQSLGFNWLSSALIRFGKEEYVQAGGVRRTFRVRLILLSLIWGATALAFGGFYIFGHNILAVRIGLSGRILWAVPLFLTLWVLGNEVNSYLRVFGKYTQVATAGLISQLFQVGALYLLYKYVHVAGIDWLIALSVGGSVAQSLFLALWLRRDNFRQGLPTANIRNELDRTVRYSSPAIPTSVLSYIYNPIEFYLILYFVSVAAVGLFNTANSMNTIFVQFVMLFPNLMFPILQGLKSMGRADALRKYFHRIVPQLTILFALAVSISIVCLPPIVRILLSQRYYPAIGAFLILAYGEIAHMPTALQSIYSGIYDKLKQSFWVTVVQYAFELSCYFILIPRIGIEGAAWGWVAAYLASSFLLNHYVAQEFGFSLGANLSVILSVAIGLGALLLARSGIPFVLQFGALLVMVISTCVAVKFAKLFKLEDMDLLIRTGIPGLLKVPLRFLYRVLG